MAESWRERITALRGRLRRLRKKPARPAGSTAKVHSEEPQDAPRVHGRSGQSSRQAAGSVAINLGIDFGTSFTKICFRDVGSEESGIVTFDGHSAEGALVPSVVAIDGNGKLYIADRVPARTRVTLVPYLKMRLAGVPIGDDLPAVAGVDLNAQKNTRVLASWFLATVLDRSKRWIARHEKDRLKNRDVVWSANVGVPVEHYDSPAVKTFEQVLAVAWLWLKHNHVPKTIGEAIGSYEQTLPRLDAEIADFHAVPEIAAAVQSFVMSREAVPGIYVYFDIGGGTVDGVAFKFLNVCGDRRVNFYSGKVASLGISALAARLGSRDPASVSAATLSLLLDGADPTVEADCVAKVRRLVGEVVITAKRKDGRNWQRDAIQSPHLIQRIYGPLELSRMQPLVVFTGGGGAHSEWYKSAISSTYERFQHRNAGIPPYKLVEVPTPGDLAMDNLPPEDFRRFAISYGLSIPYGEGPEVGLPSQFEDVERRPVRKIKGVVDYMDSKDVYD